MLVPPVLFSSVVSVFHLKVGGSGLSAVYVADGPEALGSWASLEGEPGGLFNQGSLPFLDLFLGLARFFYRGCSNLPETGTLGA